MADVFSKAKRSEVMSRICSRWNRDTELALVRIFRAHRITGWRRQVEMKVRRRSTSPRPSPQSGEGEVLRVRPDFIFPERRLAVFVDGCFWHGCLCHSTKPKNNVAFWRKKCAMNKAHDRLVSYTLRRDGWRVLRVWEHEPTWKHQARLLRRIQKALTSP